MVNKDWDKSEFIFKPFFLPAVNFFCKCDIIKSWQLLLKIQPHCFLLSTLKCRWQHVSIYPLSFIDAHFPLGYKWIVWVRTPAWKMLHQSTHHQLYPVWQLPILLWAPLSLSKGCLANLDRGGEDAQSDSGDSRASINKELQWKNPSIV